MTEFIRNTNTGQIGALIKHCRKTVKVCIEHPTIKNAHAYRYWRAIETTQRKADTMDEFTQDTSPQDIGELIARVYRWRGDKIAAAFFAALTEANYHTERAALARVWARADELRNLIENEGNEDQAAAYLAELDQLKGA